ncbi:MAG: hypothetical protein AB1847_14960 [bacterium]
MKIGLLILGLCLAQGYSALLYAHGIEYSLGSGGIVVQASFDDHLPAKGLSVAVFAPNSKEKFQTGKTDLNGRFAFFPDKPGEWEILVFDQMGHRLEIKVPVNETMKVEGKREEKVVPLYLRISMGIAVIFGLIGCIGLAKRARRHRQ